mmetsp:Transcript_29565/g.45082  ORF Transcript_29565/g.45082 Transcript_29565/m.45082 type:complete len:80 (-) Transcript_29565:2894-3133(-)
MSVFVEVALCMGRIEEALRSVQLRVRWRLRARDLEALASLSTTQEALNVVSANLLGLVVRVLLMHVKRGTLVHLGLGQL